MELQKSGNSTGSGTEVVERYQIAKESVAGQCRKMRGGRKRCHKDSRFC